MASESAIEWTDSTWNPIRGCSAVSQGCKNCYASSVARRFSGPGGPYEGLVRINAAGKRTREWNGVVKAVPEHLLDPLKWKSVVLHTPNHERLSALGEKFPCSQFGCATRPRRIFVNSMSDLFHENLPDEEIAKIVAVMVRAHWHTYQVLTKRAKRMRDLLSSEEFWQLVDSAIEEAEGADFEYCPPLRHIQWGVSVENQETADERIPVLLQTPAALRFISAEPLLGLIDLDDVLYTRPGIDKGRRNRLRWVICGGESGPGARTMQYEWAQSLALQCKDAGVPFFFKQGSQANWHDYKNPDSFPEELRVRQFPENNHAQR